MLVKISASNFRSINQRESFSMEAGKTRNFSERTTKEAGTKLLKFKAIYGPNASGKSTLIRIFDFMQSAVVTGIPSRDSISYCRLNEENARRPSLFEVELVLDGKYYIYGFEAILSENRFTQEWLYERKGTNARLIFSRDIEHELFEIQDYHKASLNERLRIYAEDIKADKTVLFLRAMNQNRASLYEDNDKILVFKNLYLWFRNHLSVNYPDAPLSRYMYFFDSQGSSAAEKILKVMDTGISKVKICDVPAEKIKAEIPQPIIEDIIKNLAEQKAQNIDNTAVNPSIVLRNLEGHSMYMIELRGEKVECKTIKFNHEHANDLFTLEDESDGTVRLLDLIEVLLSKKEDTVYVIDEVNRCLHPMITKQFVKYFLKLAEKRNIQLITTTHETDLMDLDLLRQDEIGFVERRNSDGSTHIFGLEDYGARFDKKIRTAYMKGQYDAVPRLETLQ